jgi:Asp-tRNA(Asn)/Glu-tRNA(Gln) amidotransferase A subunit family amidase
MEGNNMRRAILKTMGALGITAPVFGRALTALAEGEPAVTPEMIRNAEWIAGIEMTDEQRGMMRDGVAELLGSYRTLRAVPLDNGVAPALVFHPLVPRHAPPRPPAPLPGPPAHDPPADEGDLAFSSVTDLAAWLRAGKLTARELAELSLRRLERYDPALSCVIERTADLAMAQAAQADTMLRDGRADSGLVGLPWGAKDLLAVPGTHTTWGAAPYRDQQRQDKAAVAERLEAAGAVLTAKLSVGALAWGDVWFGGTTKNPWNPEQGSSGSSAGPASATAAGLVSFAIGTETWGSIVSPSTRCGVTGLRPTFGRVSRHGCMALSWSMDKIGPMARSAEDCARIFAAIQGADGRDPAARDAPFRVPEADRGREFRVGIVRELFDVDWSKDVEDEAEKARAREWIANDRNTLEEIGRLRMDVAEIRLPQDVPIDELGFILTAEASAAFDDLTRSGRAAELTRQVADAWPNVFRQGQTIPAVEYLRANRIRRLLMERLEEAFEDIDAFVAPTFGGSHLLMTNLTGHPSITMPNGFRASDGTPTSITFTGKLDGEENLLAIARLWQEDTGYHLLRPPMEKLG